MNDAAMSVSPTSEPSLYCIVPPELGELREHLERHFASDPRVEVVVERRTGERRSGSDRRSVGGRPPRGVDLRRTRLATGRRISERRAVLIPMERLLVPGELRPYADLLTFAERRPRVRAPAERARGLDTEGQLALSRASIDTWREMYRQSERDAEELAAALVGLVEEVREEITLSPRRFAALHRAEQALERYREPEPLELT
jgi:hypothetical protein